MHQPRTINAWTPCTCLPWALIRHLPSIGCHQPHSQSDPESITLLCKFQLDPPVFVQPGLMWRRGTTRTPNMFKDQREFFDAAVSGNAPDVEDERLPGQAVAADLLAVGRLERERRAGVTDEPPAQSLVAAQQPRAPQAESSKTEQDQGAASAHPGHGKRLEQRPRALAGGEQ
jgi:hypothetical protein